MQKRILLLLLIAIPLVAQSQERPRVGLCLSGGGAKGLAHIGLLKLIDSLGIKVDYITGTSMGSIIGGLYAIGYTGKQIDSIARAADWDQLLSQYVPMNQIYADEKDEYKRYIGEIPINRKWQIHITGFIEGQELLSLLTRLTRHVNHIHSFSDLPIPFKCVGVDIVNITPVVLDHGSLAIAMRASMAIPTVFKPVKIDGKLLVDGGVMMNFPVRELKKMGAEFVIGSYTGGRLRQEEEMNTIDKLLLQSSMFYSINESKEDIELCNIFSNLNENMKKVGSGDFYKANKIIDIGIRDSRAVLPQLIELANSQKNSGLNYSKPKLEPPSIKVRVDSIIIDTLANPYLDPFIRKRLTIKPGDSVTYRELDETVRNIYGTRNFFKAYYNLERKANGDYNVRINLQEDFKLRLKGALHFDNEMGSGIIVNATARNLFGKPSRLVASADLAEAPKYRLSYKKYLRKANASLLTEFFSEVTDLKEYDIAKGNVNMVARTDFSSFNFGYLRNTSFQSTLYTGASFEDYSIRPKYNIVHPLLGIQEYDFDITSYTFALKATFQYNTLNSRIFPKSGTDLLVENKLVLLPLEDLNSRTISPFYTIHKRDSLTAGGIVVRTDTILNLDTITVSQHGVFNPYNRLFARCHHYQPLTSKISIKTGFDAGFMFYHLWNMDTTGLSGYSYSNGNPSVDNFYIGGAEQRSRLTSFIPLWGAKEGEYVISNFIMVHLGLQWEILPKLYFTPCVTYAFGASSLEHFFQDMFKSDPFQGKLTYISDNHYYMSMISSGVNIGYKAFFGPVNLNISNISSLEDSRIYLSVGYRF